MTDEEFPGPAFEEICREYLPEVLLSSQVQRLCTRISKLPYTGYLELRRCFYENLCEEYKAEGKPVDFDLFDLQIALIPFSASKVNLPLCGEKGEEYSADLSYVRRWSYSFSWDKWKGIFYAAERIDRKLAKRAAEKFFQILAPDLEVRSD